MSMRTNSAPSERQAPAFVFAPQPDLMRAGYKDDYYRHQLKQQVQTVMNRVLGPRISLRWQSEINTASDALYFILTTMLARPTLGEEYCELVQVSPDRALPSMLRRAVLVTFTVATPYLLEKLCVKLATRDRNTGSSLVQQTRDSVVGISRANLVLFYLFGAYLSLDKRFAGIRYVLNRRSQEDSTPYLPLGVLMLVQIVVTASIWSKRWLNARKVVAAPPSLEDTQMSDKKCTLCLEPRANATSTPCGHVFCWQCICGWCTTKAECPLCRQQLQPQQLVRLYNYL
eukprot:TRINITY_DN11106_c0_g1_i1.p2 TRINITY_DN11106_c0_g1~~TRINITY_DN11106_c0_g1_i1.p2  ORF type:complete len:286 (-),score=42.72 TRINITY_DN11106_c0_g1_i1:206-1063(-)